MPRKSSDSLNQISLGSLATPPHHHHRLYFPVDLVSWMSRGSQPLCFFFFFHFFQLLLLLSQQHKIIASKFLPSLFRFSNSFFNACYRGPFYHGHVGSCNDYGNALVLLADYITHTLLQYPTLIFLSSIFSAGFKCFAGTILSFYYMNPKKFEKKTSKTEENKFF